MIPCAMDPTRELQANVAIKAVRPKRVQPERKHRKRCTRCKLLVIGNVSHATDAECLGMLISRHKMQTSIAQRATKAKDAEQAKTREWKLKAETANGLLRASEARERALSGQVERLESDLDELTGATKEVRRELREKARAIEVVGRRVERLNAQVGGLRRSG